MRSIRCSLPLLLVLLASVAHGQDLGWIRAQAMRDNVVSIRSDYGVGFGFIVGEREGVLYIVTANHVVRGPDDGGPQDRANVEIEFFTERGSTYSAVLEETWLSSSREDLAVISITTPPRFKWRYEGFAPPRDDVAGTLVWTVGRDGEWLVAEEPGQLRPGPRVGVLVADGFDAVAVGGMSGGIVVSQDGVEGLVQAKLDAGGLQVLSLGAIQRFMEAWGHPWGIGGIERSFTAHERQTALGKTLIVADGETRRITRRDAELIVERFSMGQNSRLVFDNDVRKWSIAALTATFAPGAAIDGRGWNGRYGQHGEHGRGGSDCQDGGDGRDGRDGEDGGHGVDIAMKLGIRSIDGLIIVLDGGDGGTGGNGGGGGRGGSNMSTDCTTGDGGDGGAAGHGGDGGDGGILVLDYIFVDDPQRQLSAEDLRFRSRGGEGGPSGSTATGGSAGTSHRLSTQQGRDGQFGPNGRYGTSGGAGELVVRSMVGDDAARDGQ